MASQYRKLPLTDSIAPPPGVDSFNGRTGIIASQFGDYDAALIGYTPSGDLTATNVQDALDEIETQIPTFDTLGNYKVLSTDGTGVVVAAPGWEVEPTYDGLIINTTQTPDGETGGPSISYFHTNIEPISDSPGLTYQLFQITANVDNANSGFDFGTGGRAVDVINAGINHHGTGDSGSLNLMAFGVDIGNGTDPIDVQGVTGVFIGGQIHDNVNMSAQMQAYGVALNATSGATIANGANMFFDQSNFDCDVSGYQTFNASPSIDTILNNGNYVAFNTNAAVDNFQGNAGYVGLAVSPNLGTFDPTGNFQGVSIAPNITSGGNVLGLNIYLGNANAYAGVAASLVIQDLTITSVNPGTDANNITVEYIDDTVAGSEVANFAGNAITVHMEAGVSTANQIKTALEANPIINVNTNITVSGVGSNPQTAQAATNLAGGENPGSKKAIEATGDVSINGSLSFSGALSIGALNAFISEPLVDSGGAPGNGHGLITSPTVADNTTIANADYLGVNTAMLLQIGDNCTVTTGLVGVTALGLPAVVEMGTGSTVDVVGGAIFALSLSNTAAGGTIDELRLCSALTIPNGITAVTVQKAYNFALPFGDPATTTFGVYMEPDCHNYMQGNLLIGGTPGSDDVVVNDSVGLELNSTTKAILSSRMDTAQRDALTAVNGMVLYNTDTDKLQVYAGGSWVNLH